MKKITRRSFLKTTAKAAAVTIAAPVVLPEGWYGFANPAKTGYFESDFGITDSLCHKVLAKALAKGGDYADLFFEHTISNYIMLEDGKVNRAYSDVALGVGIRTVKGDQVGYGFTQEMTEESMLNAAGTAATIANDNPTKPSSEFRWIVTKSYYPTDYNLVTAPLESKLPLVQSANEKCFSLSPLVSKVNATFHDQQKRILVVTSDGAKAEDLQPRNYLGVSVVAEKDGKREQSGWNFGGRRGFADYTQSAVNAVSKKAVDGAIVLFDAVQPPAGEMPVVLGPGLTGVLLHEAIGHGMEADFNRKKQSTFATMIGKKVAEPFVTIVDDGTVPNLTGSINFDDEGTPSQKTVLVEKGILKGYLHDKISAKHYKVKPTGNGRRQSYQHYVIPRMRNTYMEAGQSTPEDVIKSAKTGIYVEDVANGEVKIGEGDFAFYVSAGRMIENGKLAAPIKDINIMGNGPKMLANITMMGSDLEFFTGGGGACGKDGQAAPCSFGQPSCLVKSMTVGGRK